MQNKIQGYRLSPQQERLWLLQQTDGSLSYRVHSAILIEGNLKISALKAALENVINQHEILRTTFYCLPEMAIPVQVIADKYIPSIDGYDLSRLKFQEQEIEIEALFAEGNKLDIDFEQDSLLHISLVTLSPCKHILLLNLPAICADIVTLNNLILDISRFYTACLDGEKLSDEPLQYIVVSEWLNELLESEDGKIAREYWHKQDISDVFTFKLPWENHSQTQTFEPQFFDLLVRPNLLSQLRAIALQYNTSISEILLTCWLILLWRLTGQSNIVVGTGCDGRTDEELKEAFGLLTKYLPLRCHLEKSFRFSELLKQVQELQREIYQWQECFSWQQIQTLAKNNTKSDFFPICFDFEKRPGKYYSADIEFSIYKLYACIDKFKVKLSCIEQDDSLTTKFQYDSNLFYLEDIKRLAGQFHQLLESIINNPNAEIDALEILTDAERQQLLVDNNTNDDIDKCIHHLVEQQCQRTPNSVAVVFEAEQLTYLELNQQANRVAHYLQTLGVKPEVRVGICMKRSLAMVIGLLGILKAGGAYVPLDPGYPQERLDFMLKDCQIEVLLTQQSLVAHFEHQGQTVYLDSDWAVISSQSSNNPACEVSPNNLAYIIYTSGSTGQPKGVMIPHRALCNHMLWMQSTWPLSATDSVLQKTPFSFDASVWEFYAPLLTGARLIMAQPEGHKDTAYLVKAIKEHQVTILQLVPSMLPALLLEPELEQCHSLRHVYCGGEVLNAEVYQQFQNKLSAQLHNLYGPTEACIDATAWTCKPESKRQTLPIGYPIANMQIYLLDAKEQLLPIGVAGELYIGGAGLARGYFNRPELTAQKFIPNPFSSEPGSRLYKTGDLARYLPDGIEFLGRIDEQVKIRGFRIELGEVEVVMHQHPAVQQAVVVVREDVPGNKRLVAYLTVKSETVFSTQELQEFLKQKLPDYMVPSSFVVLKALPLTPNGKINRHALPAPDVVQSQHRDYVAPRTSVEEAIASIWTEVLGRKVGIHDNFFELGGDSILSIQVVARANQAGIVLTPKQIFQYQTIAELAEVAGNTQITVFQGLVTGQALLTPIQQWFFEQQFQQPNHWNQAILLEVHSPLDVALLEQAVQQLLVHHDALRLQFVHSFSGLEQVHTLPDASRRYVQVVDLSSLPQTEQTIAIATVANQLQTSLNLESGLLVQVALFDLGLERHQRLLFIIHHLVIDGVSWRILLEDLQTAYQQLDAGQAIVLPRKTTSFQDWSQRLHAYAQTATLKSELDYWLNLDWSSITALPIDYPQGKNFNIETNANSVSVKLAPQQTQALLQNVPQAYNTQINDVLLAALVQAFAQWTGNYCLLIDLEGHGREEILPAVDLSRTVGWFTTVFPVLLELKQTTDSGEALKLVKEQLRRIPNNGIGYGILKYLTQDTTITKKLQALPQAEVSFNYLGQLDRVLLPGMLQPATESTGSAHSPDARRSYLLDVSAAVIGGSLELNWTYSTAVHRPETIASLAQNYLQALHTLIAHCESKEAGGYTPSDFPAAKLSQKDIDSLIATISQTEGRK
ncbi:MAG: amino acid adenylation domain-containing protein [Nostoc sp.]